MCHINNLSLSREQASNLWYSQEENDLFNACFFGRVREVRSQLRQNSALLDKGGATINVAAILGLEKHLSPELTAEYKQRRKAVQRAVLAEHRQHRAMLIPHATARLATVSAQHSRWARERARAAAVLLEQDVIQDMKDMNLQVKTQTPRRVSMPHLNEADAAEEGHLHPCQRRWEADAAGGRHHFQRRWSSSSWSWGSTSTT